MGCGAVGCWRRAGTSRASLQPEARELAAPGPTSGALLFQPGQLLPLMKPAGGGWRRRSKLLLLLAAGSSRSGLVLRSGMVIGGVLSAAGYRKQEHCAIARLLPHATRAAAMAPDLSIRGVADCKARQVHLQPATSCELK